jgi:hypothetical protein
MFDKQKLRQIREAMQEALENAGIHDVTIKVGNCSYSGGEATYKVQVLLDGADTQEQIALTHFAQFYKLDTTRISEIGGQKVTLVGYNTNAKKMPWQVKSLTTDKQWKLTHNQALEMFEEVS